MEITQPATPALLHWKIAGKSLSARWRSEAANPPPRRVVVADDTTTADAAYKMACEGTAMLWQGDFQNARQLLQALSRRVERKPRKPKVVVPAPDAAQIFHLHRQAQSQRARVLAMLLVPLAGDYSIALRRAPAWQVACEETYGPADGIASVVTLRELLGLVGAHEWRKKGVEIAPLGARIYPHYGVFSPVRGEYIALVKQAPLPSKTLAFDIGTGTGVLAAVLARRGVQKVVATELDQRALDCARDNLQRLDLVAQVEVLQADLFPPGKAPLVVCNPPWIPARPSSPIEAAVYDADSRMLHGFIDGLAEHLEPAGEGWLILSDLAEHLGLRTRDALLARIAAAGLRVVDRMEAQPTHAKAKDASDPLHSARSQEVTSLWRLMLA